MRVTVFVMGLVIVSAPALADEKCRAELAAAYAKQAAAPKLRTAVTAPIQGGMSGTIERTIDLVRPDKIFQRVKSSAEEGLAETIVIGVHAWSNNGMGWDEIQPNLAKAMSLDVVNMNKPQTIGADFACLGKTSYEGKEYLGYRGAPGKGDDGTDLITLVYVDAATGLPAHNIVQPAGDEKAAPLVKVSYGYSDDIVVEAPFTPAKAASEEPSPAASQPNP